MSRSKSEILCGLDPHNPLSVQALIDFHREAFGGWKMEADPGIPPEGQGTPPAATGAPQGDDKGKPEAKPDSLGEGGLKALQAERDARKALESELGQLKTGLAQALGVKEKDAKSGSDDIVAALQQQMATMQRDNLVLGIANEHQITDKDDLDLLRGLPTEESMRKLATRLKPSGEPSVQQGKRTPAPDPSQGRGAGSAGPRGGGMAAGAEMFASRKKPTTTP